MPTLFISAILLAAAPIGETQEQAIYLSAKDIAKQGAADRQYIRFLWLPKRDESTGEKWRIISFHANQLSDEPEIVSPRKFGNVAAVDLRNYGWSKALWEKFAKVYPYPYTDAAGLDYLVQETKSAIPLVRADWFLWQTAIQDQRVPGYYDFIHVRNEADFDKLVGLDREILKRFPKHVREAVAESTVTHRPRRIERVQTVGGGYWFTSDVRKDQATGKKNSLETLGDPFVFDARESFAPGPNGLMYFGLFNSNGERVDSAPDFIASSSTGFLTEKRVHICLECLKCHTPNLGINPIDGYVRGLYRGSRKLKSPDYDELKRLTRLYFEHLEPIMDDDRRVYERATMKATAGLSLKEVGKLFGQMFAEYDGGVTLERAAFDLNVTPQAFQDRIRKQALAAPVNDILEIYTDDKPKTLPIEEWHSQYTRALILMRGGQ